MPSLRRVVETKLTSKIVRYYLLGIDWFVLHSTGRERHTWIISSLLKMTTFSMVGLLYCLYFCLGRNQLGILLLIVSIFGWRHVQWRRAWPIDLASCQTQCSLNKKPMKIRLFFLFSSFSYIWQCDYRWKAKAWRHEIQYF